MPRSKAIVTLAIGKEYGEQWNRLCRANWQSYADRHGYDVVCLEAPLDTSERARRRSPAWQKCLILGAEPMLRYERVVWIDSDILINARAPCVCAAVPVEKVGAVDQWATPTPELYAQGMERLFEYWGSGAVANHTARDYYARWGLPPAFDQVAQTGVLVLSPRHHRPLLEGVYFEYEEKGGGEWNYEMRPLSYELLKADLVHWIDPRFNWPWIILKALHYPFLLRRPRRDGLLERLRRRLAVPGDTARSHDARRCATAAFLNGFFLHFAGSRQDIGFADSTATGWRELAGS
jgi:hypothetical protein